MDLQCLQCLVYYCMVHYILSYVCVWRMVPYCPQLSWSAPFKTQHIKPVSPRLNTFNPAVCFSVCLIIMSYSMNICTKHEGYICAMRSQMKLFVYHGQNIEYILVTYHAV